MESELKSLRIDRSRKRSRDNSPWAKRWIRTGVTLLVMLGLGRFLYARWNPAPEVRTVRVRAAAGSGEAGTTVILNATGYIVAHHKIQVASKIVGRVAWIGVEKGDKVKEGQTIVRLEDDEYRAQRQQAQGQLLSLEARLDELTNGSRPEEIARAKADVSQAEAELTNARINLERVKKLVAEGVFARQTMDDAQARFDLQEARVKSLERTFELARIGPRREQIAAVRGQIEQARGSVAFFETQLANTVIRAPVTGTILERAVEKGEFVTTSFVGERGAKGYVVSLADLNDLQVELDINQNDFAKLSPQQKGIITTDAFPDRKYQGIIYEISPEANRQKATVQVKVKVLSPDEYLRPEMNANVAFYTERKADGLARAARPPIVVPASAVRNGAVFVVLKDKVIRRAVKTGGTTAQGVQIEDGLIGGEDLVVNPAETLQDGMGVTVKTGEKP